MSKHRETVSWQRMTEDFDYKTFDRTHSWHFSGGQILQGSSAPAFYGDPRWANPEEGLVAALSSCQILIFLAIVALKGFVVESHEDEAEGELSKNAKGKTMISRITLRLRVTMGGEKIPDAQTLESLYGKAKENCFISNSLLTEVVIVPR